MKQLSASRATRVPQFGQRRSDCDGDICSCAIHQIITSHDLGSETYVADNDWYEMENKEPASWISVNQPIWDVIGAQSIMLLRAVTGENSQHRHYLPDLLCLDSLVAEASHNGAIALHGASERATAGLNLPAGIQVASHLRTTLDCIQ